MGCFGFGRRAVLVPAAGRTSLSIPWSSRISRLTSSSSLSSLSQTLIIPRPLASSIRWPFRSTASFSRSDLTFRSSVLSSSFSLPVSLPLGPSSRSVSSFLTPEISGGCFSNRANAAAARSSLPLAEPATFGLANFLFPASSFTLFTSSPPNANPWVPNLRAILLCCLSAYVKLSVVDLPPIIPRLFLFLPPDRKVPPHRLNA